MRPHGLTPAGRVRASAAPDLGAHPVDLVVMLAIDFEMSHSTCNFDVSFDARLDLGLRFLDQAGEGLHGRRDFPFASVGQRFDRQIAIYPETHGQGTHTSHSWQQVNFDKSGAEVLKRSDACKP